MMQCGIQQRKACESFWSMICRQLMKNSKQLQKLGISEVLQNDVVMIDKFKLDLQKIKIALYTMHQKQYESETSFKSCFRGTIKKLGKQETWRKI